MPRSSRDEEFSAFVQTRRTGLVRSACLLTAGDTHLAEDLVQTSVRRCSSSGAESFLVPLRMACEVGVLATAGTRRPGVPQLTAPGTWLRACRSPAPGRDGLSWCGFRGARHPGLLAPRSASGLGGPREAAGPAPTAFNRAGEKLRAAGESCPGSETGLVPYGRAGSLSPHRGGRSRAPAAVRADGCAGQAASGWQRGACWQAAAPEATAASQLVPWTTME
jgi:hypothetical protein